MLALMLTLLQQTADDDFDMSLVVWILVIILLVLLVVFLVQRIR